MWVVELLGISQGKSDKIFFGLITHSPSQGDHLVDTVLISRIAYSYIVYGETRESLFFKKMHVVLLYLNHVAAK